jgi:hypothetical protein
MVNKRHLHHVYRRLRPISPWFFLAAAFAFGVISVGALRQNNIRMLELREAVYIADEKNTDIEKPLRELREYVHAHMNTDLSSNSNGIYPPIQLKYRYERLVKKEKDRITKANEQIYAKAQATCEQRFPGALSGGRIPCVQSYLSSNGIKEKTIPDALYKFDFVSPRWSPDLAGWSLVATGIFTMLFVVRWLSEWWMRSQLD